MSGVLKSGLQTGETGHAVEKNEPQSTVFALAFSGEHLVAGGRFLSADDLTVRGIAEWTCQPFDVNGRWDAPISVGWAAHVTPGAGDGDFFATFGGWDGLDRLSSTWVRSGGTWTEQLPATVPAARNAHEMIHDSGRGVYVMHGGSDGSPLNETWEYDGIDWSLRSTSGPALYNAGFAYDENRGVGVWYGGTSSSGRSRSTFEWDGTNWTLIPSNSPPDYRSNHAMAYDPVEQRCVMFGGQLVGNVYSAETWVYGGTWSQIVTSGPAARRHHTMTFDPVNGGILLHGGENAGGVLGDTWLFRDDTWTLVDPGGVMPDRRNHAAFFDAATGRLHLVAGHDGVEYLSDVSRYEVPNLALTSVTDPAPVKIELPLRSFPNPFTRSTVVRLEKSMPGPGSLKVFDVRGRLVKSIPVARGEQGIVWHGDLESGGRAAAGIYYFVLEEPHSVQRGKVLLLR
jgi:hypothetical protein